MRLFVALDIDEAIQQRLEEYVRSLQPRLPSVRFVGRSTYHVTLKFLGEFQAVEAVRRNLRAVRAPGFQVGFGGVGFFPNASAPRVFWAGVHAPALPGLARAIDQALAALGFPQESKLQPHLTLARNGSGRAMTPASGGEEEATLLPVRAVAAPAAAKPAATQQR